LVSLIQETLGMKVIFEPHDQWQAIGGTEENLLDRFYKDTARWAYTFQSYAFVTRVRAQQEHVKKYPHMPHILERSVYSDRYCFAKNCFELGLMSSLEWQLYQEWFAWLVDTYTTTPTGFIYLRATPETCYSRLLKRNRHEESDVALDYLSSLHEKHEHWLIDKTAVSESLKQVPVLVLDGDKDFAHDLEHRHKIIEDIRLFVQQLSTKVPLLDSEHSLSL
jgi:deoxyadenosine/deoxycytidine kinase